MSVDLASTIVRRRGHVAIAWLMLALPLAVLAPRSERVFGVSASVPGSESARADSILQQDFTSAYSHYLVLVATGLPAPHTDSGGKALREVDSLVRAAPGVVGLVSALDVPDSLLVGERGRGALFVVGLRPAPGQDVDALVPGLRAATAEAARRLRLTHPQVALRWTGETALNFDFRESSAVEARLAERRVLPLTLVLLLVAFGGIVAALVPVFAGALAIAIALGAAVLLDRAWPLSVLLQSVVSLVGLGLGIDYALLMVSRFRESRSRGLSPDEAATEAARRAGRTVLLSGLPVMLGFAALLLVPLPELQSVGAGGLMVTVTSVMLATTLLPGVLAALGPRADGRHRPAGIADGGGLTQRWANFVVRRPLLVLLLAGAPLLLLASEGRRMRAELPPGDWLPADMESARAVRDLEAMGRGGAVHALRVLVQLPPGQAVTDPGGWRAVRRIADYIAADARVRRVRSLPSLLGGSEPNAVLLAAAPVVVRQALVSENGRIALVEVVPREGVPFHDVGRLVTSLRAVDAARLAGIPGTALLIAGTPAFNADYVNALVRYSPRVVLLVVIGTFVALAIGFRSVLVPLKAVLLNLLAVGAAFGAVVLVLQDGHLRWLVGMSAPLGAVFPAVPIVTFCIVFGLSMDYEVFLISRVLEARRAGASDSEAVAEGVARTAGTITSAAAIMIAVFAAFVLSGNLFMKTLGFALAVAVFLDATVVRLAVGPALLRLAGRWNWWPARVPATQSAPGGERALAPPPAPGHLPMSAHEE